MEEDLKFYDLIIDIESFNDLKSEENDGWKIFSSEKGMEKYEYFKDENTDGQKSNNNKLLNRIGILGVSQVGKTFILKKLINKGGNPDQKKTKGISVIYPETTTKDAFFVCLDSQGSEEPIIDKKKTTQEVFDLDDEQRTKLVKDLSKDKKFTEIFIQDFIIENSNILIVVVDQLTFSEQKLINRLKNNKNFEKLFVIHNTQFFEDKDIIELHIENTIKKSIFSNLEKAFITNLDSKENSDNKPYYYIEKDFGNKNNDNAQQTVIHLFMAKEGSKAGEFFNEQTIQYVRKEIMTQTKTKIFDVIKEVKNFLSFNSILYMIKKDQDRPITEDDIKIETVDEDTYLRCKNKNFEFKDCIINEMGISNFTTENSINPSFVCYKGRYVNKKKNEDWPALIVKAEMFVDAKNIKISQAISSDNETMNITISSEKKFEEDKNIKLIEEIEGGDIKEGTMRISIKFKLQNFKLEEKKSQIREPFPGIKLIYFQISDKNNKNEDLETKIIKKEKKEKTKP